MTDYLEIMPFTQRAMLKFTMDQDPKNTCDIMFELIFEPWVLESLSDHLGKVSTDLEFNMLTLLVAELSFSPNSRKRAQSFEAYP